MERRQPLFLAAQVRNIDEYIKKTGLPLPRIWAIHDEFGDWMQVKEYKEEITVFVNRLAQKARAAGIYLIFAAQRPEASIFPMVLRSNLGNRLILKVDSAGTSDLSLGVKGLGAEKLLPHGHMLAITGETNGPVYCQVPYISEEDVVAMVSAICQRCKVLPNELSSGN
jgi:S-DNA-T family DNA segregation ATPase FtsK/SpoIIIE